MEKELTASKRSKSSDTSATPVPSDNTNPAEEILRHVSVGVQTDACLTANASTQTSAFEISTFVSNNGTSTPVRPHLTHNVNLQTTPGQLSSNLDDSVKSGISSSYILSNSSSESENISSEDEDIPTQHCNTQDSEMCLVFTDQLKQLFTKCLFDPFCNSPIASLKKFFNGSMLCITTTCCNSHTHVWRSQPMVNNTPKGNVVVAAATLFSGNTFHTIAEIAEACSLHLFSEKTFYSVQNKLLFPTINSMYKVHQQELYAGIANTNLVMIFYRL